MSDLTLKQIRAEVRRMDPALAEDDPAFASACLLIALTFIRPATVRALSDFLQIPRPDVAERLNRLRGNGLLVGWGPTSVLRHSGWDDEETGGIAFWCDVNIAEGMLERSRA